MLWHILRHLASPVKLSRYPFFGSTLLGQARQEPAFTSWHTSWLTSCQVNKPSHSWEKHSFATYGTLIRDERNETKPLWRNVYICAMFFIEAGYEHRPSVQQRSFCSRSISQVTKRITVVYPLEIIVSQNKFYCWKELHWSSANVGRSPKRKQMQQWGNITDSGEAFKAKT